MFTHPIAETNSLIRVVFSEYSKRHYLKSFEKTYKGKQWQITVESILEDLRRIRIKGYTLQHTQQVDEIWHSGSFWIFKYDFTIAGTQKSTKNSGNRCVVFLDIEENFSEILIIYHKTHLPKNIGEQQWIKKILQTEFLEYLNKTK